MPRRPLDSLVDTLLLLALSVCLFGLALPWLSGALAQTEDAASPGEAIWLIDLAAHWQLYFAAGWAVLLAVWSLRERRRLRWLPLLALAALPWLSAAPALDRDTLDRDTHALNRDALNRDTHEDRQDRDTRREDRDTHHQEDRQQHRDTHPPLPHTLRIATANVHVTNRDPAPLVAWLQRHPVDVLVVPELGPAYAEALNAALPELPHRALHPQADSAFGIGLYARLPLRDVVAAPDADGILTLGATLDLDGRPVRVVGLHPMPPVAPHWHAARDRLLRQLASGRHPALGADPRLPRLLAGDLNATPWSSALQVAADGGLRRATGFRSTWPMQWGGHLGIPIDHVLGSAEWRVVSTLHGPDIGSDHAPIRVELRLALPPQ